MIDFDYFFSKIDELPCYDIFLKKIKGYSSLDSIWDILARIQQGFISELVNPGINGKIEEGAILKDDNIQIGKGTVVESGAVICGPAIIGENVQIRHSAYIRGNVIIGNDSVVGHCTEIIRSILLPSAKAPHFNYVGDSILGSKVNLGAGTKLSNFKNDGTNIKIVINNSIVDTGLRKFGAILSDGCQFGCNSVANPGTLMSKNCRVYPCATVKGYYEPNTIVKLRQHTDFGKVNT